MDSLAKGLSSKTSILGLKVSEVVGIAGIVLIFLFSLSLWLSLKKRSKCMALCNIQMPGALKEITVDLAKQIVLDAPQTTHEDIKKQVVVLVHGSTMTQRNFDKAEKDFGGWEPKRAAERKNNGLMNVANRTDPLCVVKDVMEGRKGGCHPHLAKVPHGNGHSCRPDRMPAEVSHMGLGQWYTLRELEAATGSFVNTNVLGEGGYGVVYLGLLADGTCVAVKKLFNNRGQAEREFKVEVEAIGRVWHKNLVRLTGYCMEGSQRMLVYEFVDNGNLSQWLHGSLGRNQPLPWDIRMKIILGTAKGLAYLHEGLEPKVVHRDVKSSNILIDSQWNAKVSDFGLAKLLGAENSHVTTRVMGTFGYVAPEYALTGMLTEKSDVYSYGVLVMEIVTGRVPVDYGRPVGEVNLVDWLKTMIGHRLFDEVADPRMPSKPSPRSLKRALLVALRCVDPDAQKRPKMGHVVHTLEADDGPVRRVPFG